MSLAAGFLLLAYSETSCKVQIYSDQQPEARGRLPETCKEPDQT